MSRQVLIGVDVLEGLEQRLADAEALIQAAIAYREKWNANHKSGLWECHLALLRATAEFEEAAKRRCQTCGGVRVKEAELCTCSDESWKRITSESCVHELLHAFQEILGREFNDAEVEAAIEAAKGGRDDT